MIKVVVKSKGEGADNFLKRVLKQKTKVNFDKYGKMGVEALEKATPRKTGKTAQSWSYEINQNGSDGTTSIVWKNSNIADGWANVAVLIQYGHATRNGGYVQGIDYINPAMKPVFEEIAKKAYAEVIQ